MKIVEILSGLTATILTIVIIALQLYGMLGTTISIIIVGFIILGILQFYTIYKLLKVDRISKLLEVIKFVIDNLTNLFQRLYSITKSKDSKNYITWGDLQQLYGESFMEFIAKVGQAAFDAYFKSIKSTPEEKRKKYLMEKAKKGNITRNEAEELKKLLEKQKKEKEESGDIIGAILLGLAILFVLWLLTELAKPSKK